MFWEDLSIKEKSDLMRLYISNGIMDLDTIKEHYNAFQDGGNVKMPRGYKVSSKLMKIAQRQIDKDAALQSSDYEPDNGMPQATFLMNRKNQQKAFEQYGYTRLNNNEYGPVTNAVASSPHKDIPVYQKYPDVDVDRDNLQKIGTFLDNASTGETDVYKGPQDSYLPDPAYFPVDVYIDRKTGKVYNQGWDFNDYYNTGKAYGTSRLKNIAGNLLDRIGSPTVVTTGLQAHPYYSAEADNYIQDKTNGLLHYEMNPATGDYEIMLPSVTVTAKRTNHVSKSDVELRPASELNEEEFWDMMEANSKHNGGHLYQEGGLDNPKKKPEFKQSEEQYYDRNNDIIYAQDSIGEGYQHEYFHARPNTTLLNNLRPYYENLNDNRLIELGADLPFVKRVENDPNHFYSPEEIGARVSAARYMLNKAGINNIDIDFLRNARKNELQYGDNFRDLLHMYNDENLLQILNIQYSKGGSLGHITPYGQWQYPNQITTIPSNNITMKGVGYPVLGVSDTGDTKYMLPDMDYLFDGNYVTEYPISYQKGGQLKRVRRNDSPTQVASEKLEDKTAQHIQRFNANKIDHNYDIPYISEKEIVVPGVGRVSTNALDSIAKYSVMAGIPLEEGLGLAAQETAFGANPYYNYGSNNEANRALGNSSYFRNYGVIPANYLVRDWHYFDLTDEQRATTPPLLDAFKYWKAGKYNRGDKNHTSDVRAKGKQVINSAPVQEWMKTSPYVKKKTTKGTK